MKQSVCIAIAFAFISLLLPASLHADDAVKLNSLFSHHMVLQRNKPLPIWGTAAPGEWCT